MATLLLLGLNREVRQLRIFPIMITSPLISLGVLCYDVFTITLYRQNMLVQNNVLKLLRCTRNKQIGMWEVPMLIQESKPTVNNILDHTTKPELAKYIHAALFRSKNTNLLKAISQGFFNIWSNLTGGFIKKHLYKYMNTTMGHLHKKRQRLKSNRTTTTDTDPEENPKTNLV